MRKNVIKIILIFTIILSILITLFPINIVNTSEALTTMESISSSNLAWGVKAAGFDRYIDYLEELDTAQEVRIAVFDTGINLNHEVFEGRLDLTYSKNYVGGAKTTLAEDPNALNDSTGHGTAVAGIIAESTPSNVKIVPIKVAEVEADMVPENAETLYLAIEEVAPHVDIINFSFGFSTELIDNEDILLMVDNYFQSLFGRASIIIVCPSGNGNGSDVYFPASSDYVLGATAIDENKQVPSIACRGDQIDFALPGVNLKVPTTDSNNSYETKTGTDYSCAFLSSAVAMVKSEYPTYSLNEILDVLKENCEDLGDAGKDNVYGNGVLNFCLNKFVTTVSVINKTNRKANVYLSTENHSNVDFQANTSTGVVVVSCARPCFVLASYDSGETYKTLTATYAGYSNAYTFTFDLESEVQIIVAIKGDLDYSGILNLTDIKMLRTAVANGRSSLPKMEQILYNIDGKSILNLSDIKMLRQAVTSATATTW